MNKQKLLQLARNNGWAYVSRCKELSEEFIREFWNELNHDDISMYQKLSEEFMREFWNDLNHDNISIY